MRFSRRTHLERLIAWSSDDSRLDPGRLHRRWMSLLLPTRRFGPDAWAAFQMAIEPSTTDLGGFRAWVIYDAHAVRLLAYLEPPMAEQFGGILPFRKPLRQFDPGLTSALGHAGARFLADVPTDAESKRALDGLRALEPEYLAALRTTAPDFCRWASL